MSQSICRDTNHFGVSMYQELSEFLLCIAVFRVLLVNPDDPDADTFRGSSARSGLSQRRRHADARIPVYKSTELHMPHIINSFPCAELFRYGNDWDMKSTFDC